MRGEGKKTKKDIPENNGEAKKSSFVEIKPSGFPETREKKKFEKGGTGVGNGWGREMAHSTGP